MEGYDSKFHSMEKRKIHEAPCPMGCIFSADGKRLNGDCRAPSQYSCKLNQCARIDAKYGIDLGEVDVSTVGNPDETI